MVMMRMPKAGQLACDRQRHGMDATLGGGIGSLADLAVEGCNGSGRDDHAAFAISQRLELGCAVREQTQHVEAADQVDLDDLAEQVEIMRAVASGDPDSGCNTGAIDQDAGFAEGFGCFGQCRFCSCRVGDVAGDRLAPDLGGHFLGLFEIDIEQRDLCPGLCQCPRRGRTKT
jgi:hypothetical protein